MIEYRLIHQKIPGGSMKVLRLNEQQLMEWMKKNATQFWYYSVFRLESED